MSKKENLGRSLIKDRFSSKSRKKFVADKSMLHTTELQDGYDWGRLNLKSVTEESSFQEFLSTAELAGTEFQAEKLDIRIATHSSKNIKSLLKEESEKARRHHEQFKERLQIPRRPPWTSEMSTQELDRNEKDHFLEWRRNLAKLQEEFGCLLTPYEKNLEFWRQLWRVVERSDVVVQIVDARNPLLFRCEDLEKYVKELSEHKINLILINKADFLTEKQRQFWADYFSSINVRSIFFSSIIAAESEKESTVSEESLDSINDIEKIEVNNPTNSKNLKIEVDELERNIENSSKKLTEILEKIAIHDDTNSYKVLTHEELIEIFSTIHKGPKVTENVTTIGLVGYPNVGKSSTINALLSEKKVSVSATPGKTKHFQTLFLDKSLLLCDCPGLVMPSFVSTKAEMIINGILPIDQMRDHVPPVELVSCLIPRHVIEEKYGIMLPKPMEDEDPERSPTPEELLNTYGFYRGFMTSNGQPDNPRAARYILKDFMNGKLLYCHAPPSALQELYHIWPEKRKLINKVIPPRALRASKTDRVSAEDFDKMYFQKKSVVHSKGVVGKSSGVPDSLRNGMDGQPVKPWKKQHRKKKEKLRRVYAHLDVH